MSARPALHAAPALADWQAQWTATLLHGAAAPALAARDAGDARIRARVYTEAYRLRLVEVLGRDYPVLQAVLGASAFAALGRDYLVAHPSDRPSLRDFGRHLPRWLRRAPGVAPARRDELAELAAFEWAQGEVFDAADADVALLADLAGIEAARWAALPLRLRPSTRLLRLRGNAPARVLAHAQQQPLPAPQRTVAPRVWLLWRRGREVHWRALDDDEVAVLPALRGGCRFGALCEGLAGVTAQADVALRAASLLKRWLDDELLMRFAAPPAAVLPVPEPPLPEPLFPESLLPEPESRDANPDPQ
ncbi:HvfC/BufC N-terminal domain-containing protein [Solimonas flava]|uniref:HvfC/BufC N-terminal domain-containing protein n=1 Tax=Solimonas flava TaxID=415849 RepID=UPI0003FBF227|nr:DNA-binding domain-containing protein [Solimonas flava]